MKITPDQQTRQLRISMSEDEYQRLKIDADKLGVSVHEMLQSQIDAKARAMFPAAFKKA